MALFTYNPVQTVQLNTPAVLNDSIPCNKGYILHDNESGLVTLRGIVNHPCACYARYQVTANCNIAVPEGGTAGPIAIAIAVNGEPRLTSRAIVTPAAAEEYNHVTATDIVRVARGDNLTVSVRAVSGVDDPAATPAPAIDIQNLTFEVVRVA